MTSPFTLGELTIWPPLVLGPMAGFTHGAFRLLCRNAGAGLVVSEMVSAQGLVQGNRKSHAMLRVCQRERPVAIQIFGGQPDIMAAAAEAVAAAGADAVDINMGCAVPKVRRAQAGTALMEDPDRAVAVAAACCRAVSIPVAVKYRAGLRAGDDSYLELGRRLQDVGVAALTLHGRPANAHFRGRADWGCVAALAAEVEVPVIGSGDVTDAAVAVARLDETGCAGVMIARGALGRPWVFGQALDLLEGRDPRSEPDTAGRLGIALCHAQLLAADEDELTAARQMRTFLPHYTRGLPHAAWMRQSCVTARTLAELLATIMAYRQRSAEMAPAAEPYPVCREPRQESGDTQ